MNKTLDKKINGLYQTIINSDTYQKVIASEQAIANHESIINGIKELKVLQKESLKVDSFAIKTKQDDLFYKLQNEPIYIEYLNNIDELNEIIKNINQKINSYFENLTKL